MIVVCLAALVIADLQLGMTLFERWRLAALADVAVVIVAALTRRHLPTDAARQGGWVFLVGYGSWPGLGEGAVLCLLCALAARSSNGVSLASSVASAVAAVGAITHYRADSAYPGAMFALLLGTLVVALGIGGYLRYLGMSLVWSTRPLGRHAACRTTRSRSGEAPRTSPPSRTANRARHRDPGVFGASEVAVRGADCC